jgi:hypothetical protein
MGSGGDCFYPVNTGLCSTGRICFQMGRYKPNVFLLFVAKHFDTVYPIEHDPGSLIWTQHYKSGLIVDVNVS